MINIYERICIEKDILNVVKRIKVKNMKFKKKNNLKKKIEKDIEFVI